MLSLCTVDAKVDNTNNLQEARFGSSKSDSDRLLHSSDPGLFALWKDRNVRKTNKLWGNQMRAIGWIVERSNFHEGWKSWAVGIKLTIDEARELADNMKMIVGHVKATKFNSLRRTFLNWSPARSSRRNT